MTDTQRHLLLEVKLEEGRFHGEPEWPPAPSRVFQALVAASARGAALDERDVEALEWLESLPPPLFAASAATSGQTVKLWVPNNDLDSTDGNPSRVQEMRTGKWVRPRIFDGRVPLLYAWNVGALNDEVPAARLCEIARGLYQLGRGVDRAWARARIVDAESLAEALDAFRYVVHRPAAGGASGGAVYACPAPGSLESLRARHAASLRRFEQVKGMGVFVQPPKPRFVPVAYDSAPPRALFEIRPAGAMGAFSATHVASAPRLIEIVSDAAMARLASALGERARIFERALLGKTKDGTRPPRPDERIRLFPVPSIGHDHADRGIRRILVEVTEVLASKAEDVFWAFSGLSIETPAGAAAILVRSGDTKMLTHLGIAGAPVRRFRTITAAALPVARRRISPDDVSGEAKSAPEREDEERRARGAVIQALRHAGITAKPSYVHVQREPFDLRGARAESFAHGTRFAKERLWHVEVRFREPVAGPVAIGDGRFVGLGLMAPAEDTPGALAFRIVDGLLPGADPTAISAALRRAVIARHQAELGDAQVPALVSGHDADGNPSRSPVRLAYIADLAESRLLLIVSGKKGARLDARLRDDLSVLQRAMDGFEELRAGAGGLVRLQPVPVDLEADALFLASRRWQSRTPYVVNRHERAGDAEAALVHDVERALSLANLPRARITVDRVCSAPGVGLQGLVTLDFDVAVSGPILLGRNRFKGGGLFHAAPVDGAR